MKNIAIMGGTFDPIHYGHTNMARAALNETDIEKVILIPAYVQPFKRDKYITSDEHRLAMVNLAIGSLDNVEVSTWEIEKGGISYTFDTLMHFKDIYPSDKLWFILGADSLLRLEEWYKGIDLLKACSFMVGARPEVEREELNRCVEHLSSKYGTEILVLEKEMLPFSSTMIREALEKGEPISGMVEPMVEEYIYQNKLYVE